MTSEGTEVLPSKALAEIARAFGGVDMASMPQVPSTAPCRLPGSDPNDWFDPFRNSDMVTVDPRLINQVAAQLCEGCPVLVDCLAWGVANPAQGGILGGLTENARKDLRRSATPRRIR